MNLKLKNIFIGFTLCLLAACEVISEGDRLIPVDIDNSNRTTLLVEFSGLKCNNCPKAAEEAHNLLSLYGDKLVVVEMHPKSNTLTEAKPEWDYTCPEADEYYTFFGGTNTTPLPIGVMNMTKTNDDYFVKYQLWGATYTTYAKIMSPIALSHTIEKNANEIHLEATISNLSAEPMDIQYIAWLTEDAIIGPQMMPDGVINMEYAHNHMLRASITDTWGTALQLGAEEVKTLPISYTLPSHVNPDNCNIVGIVMKDNVAIQVHEYKLSKLQ